MRFYSQYNQDSYLENNIFKGYKNGYFMDIGAHDGITINNTLYFEKENNWSGINVEPIKEVYDKLVVNRPSCININCAVCNYEGMTDFVLNKGYPEMISGIKDFYNIKHFDRLKRHIKESGGTSEIVKVCTRKIENICKENKITHINYLSIDVEGAEFEVIKSINFDETFIDVIDFENNYEEDSIHIIKYLEDKNYVILHKSSDIFMINKDSQFYKNK